MSTLPSDSEERKGYPLMSGCLNYFPAALAGVARWSRLGNEKHNKGEPLHHARGKSMDHGDCIVRHLMDLQALLCPADRDGVVHTPGGKQALMDEADALAWRALALSQELHERFAGAPLAPGAKLPPSQGLATSQLNMDGCGVAGQLPAGVLMRLEDGRIGRLVDNVRGADTEAERVEAMYRRIAE